MQYKIVIEKDVVKFLKKHNEILWKFKLCVSHISQDPLTDFCDTKKLKWLEDTYRLRIGKRRFLYKV